ncbi:hypothetical protein N7G274_000039 [Stereocaulon virgatum]|uniref:N-acetylglucosaminylphosphatidylinositol deacetylase n=1 Tax=Stereocaulon virgatum TaxID=373712 RepID=A0ABR4AXD9_9LECA
MQLYLALAIPILLGTAWLYTAQIARGSLPSLRGKRICLLIAHPDDEAMFFSPTVLALTAPEAGNHVKILCLSSGNADGLGETRKKELAASGALLGLRSVSDVLVIEDSKFQDGMKATWSTASISQLLSSAFSPTTNAPPKKNTSEPTATIDTLITFDRHGISSHPNHISLYHGAKQWLTSLMAGKPGWRCPVELYTLTTTSVIRKYISILDAPLTMFVAANRTAGMSKQKKREEPPSLLFISDVLTWWRGLNAMVNGHKSQMRWFRWGWVTAGRYMIINDLRRETVT